jgi:hypothetical protein
MSDAFLAEMLNLSERLKAELAGKPPPVQGAALADMLAIWLAGHHPAEVREELLRNHIGAVRALLAEMRREREAADR